MASLRTTFACLFFLLSGLCIAGCRPSQSSDAPSLPEVAALTISNETAVLSSELPGRVVAAETSEVRPQVNGIIRHRLFEEGAVVEAGQTLFEIEDAPYRAALMSAEAALSRAEASIKASELQDRRYRELAKVSAVSRQDADNAQAAADQARAEVEVQRAAVYAAQIDLDFTRITAPISGRIGRSLVTPGGLVQAGQEQPLAIIQRNDIVYVDLMQSASEVLDLQEALMAGDLVHDNGNLPVQLLLPNGKVYPLTGELQFSEISVNPSTGAVALRATFANPDGLLRPGMHVRARLTEGIQKQAILAPQQAIKRDTRGRAIALVVNSDNIVEQRMLTTAEAIDNRWLVSKGLRPGDRLIVEGHHRVSPGSTVQVSRWRETPDTAKLNSQRGG
ncbi:MAG: efflux transporter periplasmic adaptor subunit [Haliea sp.]|nr:efflux transporter periplasmic adaptor subunit [Haliea sp.]|tara:strand:- start:41866 stop:43038 length:1173 start_codon:yes stop_codon:yes gene_type:complete